MKDLLTLATFAITALCFAMFIAVMKPPTPILAPRKLAHCTMPNSAALACGSEPRWSYFTDRSSSQSVFELPRAASSGPTVERKRMT